MDVDPNNSSAWLNKTALLSAGGHHPEAVEAAERAVRLKPKDPWYWQQKGTALHKAGRNEEARDAYLRAAELRPDKQSSWRSLGSVYMDLGRPRKALSAFNRSIDLGADYGYLDGWICRARILGKLGRHRRALAAYDRVIGMDPEHFEARFNRAGLLRKMARWEEALAAAEEAERLQPDNAEVKNGKGEALLALAQRDGDLDLLRTAHESYSGATHLDAENATAWSMTGITLMYLARPKPGKKEILSLSVDQVRALFAAAAETGDRLEAIYFVAVHCGLRQGELLGLKWEDVDLEAGKLSVRRSLAWVEKEPVFNPPKNGKGRNVRLTEPAAEALKRHRAAQNAERLRLGSLWEDNGLVFPGERGQPMRSYSLTGGSFKRLLERAGLPAGTRFHDLRHTCATLLFMDGLHPKLVQELLGHANISITLDTYSHVLPSMGDQAAAAMERALA